MEFEWILWPGADFFDLQDEFCSDTARVRLQGNCIRVTTQTGAEAAKLLAVTYIESLTQNAGLHAQLTTETELAAMPVAVRSSMHVSRYRQERPRIMRAMKIARGALVSHEVLRRCYDYLQDAQEEERNQRPAMVHLYKLAETIRNHFNSDWKEVGRQLAVKGELDELKRLSNAGVYDERHPPRPNEIVQPLSGQDRGRAFACATTVLRRLEAHVCGRP